MTLTDTQKFEILQLTSSHFLTDQLPDTWRELSEEDQNTFLEDHAWEPLEYHPTSEVFKIIDCAAFATIKFIEEATPAIINHPQDSQHS